MAITAKLGGPGWIATKTIEMIDCTVGSPTVDPDWRHIDKMGHLHYYANGYPTLREVVVKAHWCNGDEGSWIHDPHRHIDESYYVCAICGENGERIVPGVIPAFTPKLVPGVTIYEAHLRTVSDGGVEDCRGWLTPDQWSALLILADYRDQRAVIVEAFRDGSQVIWTETRLGGF